MKTSHLLLSILLITLSCRDVRLDMEDTEPIPTLNAILISGITPQVSLTYTVSRNSNTNYPIPSINGAEVELFENENFVETLSWDESSKTYTGTTVIKPNFTYKVIAKIPNEEWLEGVTLIPNPPLVSLAKYNDTTVLAGSNSVDAWHIFMTSNFASDNQGRFASVYFKAYRVSASSTAIQMTTTEQVIYGTLEEYYFRKKYYVLGNHAIQPNYQADFSYIIRSLATQQPNPTYDSIYTYIDVMSNDLYEYMMLLDKINARNLYDPYVEPPTTYSNVKNGMGIVGGIGRGGHSLKPE